MGRLEEHHVPLSSDQTPVQPPPQSYPLPSSSDQTPDQPPQSYPLPPSSDQTTFQSPPQGSPVPRSIAPNPFQPPPQGYPNHHDNPLSSPAPPQPTQYVVDNNMNTNNPQSAVSYVSEPTEQRPPSQSYPPQQQPAAYSLQAQPVAYLPQAQPAAYPPQAQPEAYPPQQPTAAYTPQAQPAAYPPQRSPVAIGTSCNPQIYSNTPNHNCQPQAGNYGVTTGYQPQVTTGTPNWYQPPMPMSTQEWSTGLLECFDDPENAIMTLCFPCVTFGQIAEIVDNGQTSCGTSGLIYSLVLAFIGIPCIMSCSYRTKVRSRYNLLETPAPDWVIHFFCEYCALCQEYRELKNRGMDPALGWQGNLSKQQQMANYATMTPPMNQRMMG